jgi:hypothetical protein
MEWGTALACCDLNPLGGSQANICNDMAIRAPVDRNPAKWRMTGKAIIPQRGMGRD